MDDGGIYEEGTPEEIFSNPKKERTRHFIKRLKTLSITIDGPNPDYYDIMQRLNQFGQESAIAISDLNHLSLIFEELVLQKLLPELTNNCADPKIIITFEHSALDESSTMNVTYGGKEYNPMNDLDDVSSSIIKRFASDITYSFDGENEIKICI